MLEFLLNASTVYLVVGIFVATYITISQLRDVVRKGDSGLPPFLTATIILIVLTALWPAALYNHWSNR